MAACPPCAGAARPRGCRRSARRQAPGGTAAAPPRALSPATCPSASSTPARRRSPISRRCSRISRAPTSCSSASSTTTRTRTGSSPRSSQGCARRSVAVTVSLEMFERDVQPALDDYLAGTVTRGGVPEGQRGRGRATRPTIGRWSSSRRTGAGRWSPPTCRAGIASDVAKGGLAPLSTRCRRGPGARSRSDLQCPQRRVLRPLRRDDGRPPGRERDRATPTPRATLERYYLAQCVKDETMAESIAGVVRETARRRRRRSSTSTARSTATSAPAPPSASAAASPGRRVAVVSILPVADLDASPRATTI